jgi:hypothetical protein
MGQPVTTAMIAKSLSGMLHAPVTPHVPSLVWALVSTHYEGADQGILAVPFIWHIGVFEGEEERNRATTAIKDSLWFAQAPQG